MQSYTSFLLPCSQQSLPGSLSTRVFWHQLCIISFRHLLILLDNNNLDMTW